MTWIMKPSYAKLEAECMHLRSLAEKQNEQMATMVRLVEESRKAEDRLLLALMQAHKGATN
jgi:hypothetical protein